MKIFKTLTLLLAVALASAQLNADIIMNGRQTTGGTLNGKPLLKRTLGDKIIYDTTTTQPTIIRLTPAMTGDTAPSPFVTSASSIYYSSGFYFSAWMAFDQLNYVAPNQVGAVLNSSAGWIQIDLGTVKKLVRVVIRARGSLPGSETQSPKNYTILAGTTVAGLSTLLTKSNITKATQSYAVLSDDTIAPVDCRYFRLNISANWGSTVTAIGEIELYGY